MTTKFQAPAEGDANLLESVEAYLEAQGALDNRELMGPNAPPYEELRRACNRAHEHLEDAISACRASKVQPKGKATGKLAAVYGDKWEGAEEWMPLAWELCANECGEEACAELIWEGGPIPEPWGDRWLKYEDQAKEMIAMVRASLAVVQAPAPGAESAAAEGPTFYLVLAPNGLEGVAFTDQADARYAATGRQSGFGVSTIAEAFRDAYDEADSFETVEVRAASQATAVKAEPLFLLHCGQIDSGGEQDEWETQADSYKRVEDFCRLHPGQTVKLYPHVQADPDGEAFRTAARLGLTLRFYGGCAQSSMPGSPSAYEVVSGQDRAAAMRQAVSQAAAVIASGGESHNASMAKLAAQSPGTGERQMTTAIVQTS